MVEKKASSAVKPDLIGMTSSLLVKLGRFTLSHLGKDSDSFPSRIMLCWKRNDVCVETKERGKDYVSKEYPRLIDKGWNGHNRVFKYRIPTGLSHSKLTKSINDIEFDLKSEVLFKLLENDPKAHFSLTVLSGHLLNFIAYTNEAEKMKDNGIWLVVGWSRRGLEQLEISSNTFPHLLIGGATGGGKSTLARLMFACLHMRYTRDDVRLWLCDLKHGVDIDALGENPLLVDRKISDPEKVEPEVDLLSIEIGKRYQLFKNNHCADIKPYNKRNPKDKLPHIIFFIDELTKLEGKEYKSVREKLKKVTGEARGAGVHVIMSCHRPTANLIDGTMKNNIPAVIAFKCNPVSARVILGEDDWEGAMSIDGEIEGRALFRAKDEVLVQVPYINDDEIVKIMSRYQKPQKAQSEAKQEIIKVAKELIQTDEIKKITDIEHLCDLLPEKMPTQRPKLRLVQPLGVNTGVKGCVKE
ncbi:FtsK/SpoIIIE domain-containing protein [Desulfosporosinus sp. SB140]|uniref:FtsK/SpoIIIE domain-containing protein n=1 Tax=Desulfosporosinus paludis TaxID=3115649 RepID=UPI00388E1135